MLSGLQVNTTYYISVSSRTAVGFGPYASTSARTLSARKLNASFDVDFPSYATYMSVTPLMYQLQHIMYCVDLDMILFYWY